MAFVSGGTTFGAEAETFCLITVLRLMTQGGHARLTPLSFDDAFLRQWARQIATSFFFRISGSLTAAADQRLVSCDTALLARWEPPFGHWAAASGLPGHECPITINHFLLSDVADFGAVTRSIHQFERSIRVTCRTIEQCVLHYIHASPPNVTAF